MSTVTSNQMPAEANPFDTEHSYSEAVVELMRALRTQRVTSGQKDSSPEQILSVLESLGYCNTKLASLKPPQQTRRFVMALEREKTRRNASHISCEDVLNVIASLGYTRAHQASADLLEQGLPIDRRRRETDERASKTERRDCLVPGPQEVLELTDEEHAFLDELKNLREQYGRNFASSQELLCILWSLNYRPRQNNGRFATNLTEEQKFGLQIAFTQAIEDHLGDDSDDEFLTVRKVLQVVSELGLQKVDCRD